MWLLALELDNTNARLRPFRSQMLGDAQVKPRKKKDEEKQEEWRKGKESFGTSKQD